MGPARSISKRLQQRRDFGPLAGYGDRHWLRPQPLNDWNMPRPDPKRGPQAVTPGIIIADGPIDFARLPGWTISAGDNALFLWTIGPCRVGRPLNDGRGRNGRLVGFLE